MGDKNKYYELYELYGYLKPGFTAVQKTRLQSVSSILDGISIVDIEKYLRRKKIENINKKV